MSNSDSRRVNNSGTTDAPTTARTRVRDTILESVSGQLEGSEIQAIEWASIEDTILAIRNDHPLADFDEYVGYGAAEVAL